MISVAILAGLTRLAWAGLRTREIDELLWKGYAFVPLDLVPLDGSLFSEHALPIARAIASRSDAALRLAHVHVPLDGLPIDGVPLVDPQLDQESRDHERAYLEGLRAERTDELAPTTMVVLLDGTVAAALAEEIRASRAELVVMTTHGRSGLTRVWLGSVAASLIHHVAVPLLLLRPHETVLLPPHPTAFRRITIPLDGSLFAEQVIDRALGLDPARQAEYTLLQVLDPFVRLGYGDGTSVPISAEYQVTMHRQQAAQSYLESVAQRMRADGRQVRAQVVIEQRPAVVILRHAQEHQADLIAMATHGRSGPGRFLVGSVADKVLRGADCPVLLYRPRELDA